MFDEFEQDVDVHLNVRLLLQVLDIRLHHRPFPPLDDLEYSVRLERYSQEEVKEHQVVWRATV